MLWNSIRWHGTENKTHKFVSLQNVVAFDKQKTVKKRTKLQMEGKKSHKKKKQRKKNGAFFLIVFERYTQERKKMSMLPWKRLVVPKNKSITNDIEYFYWYHVLRNRYITRERKKKKLNWFYWAQSEIHCRRSVKRRRFVCYVLMV